MWTKNKLDTNFKTLEIMTEAYYENDEYSHSILYVCHDGGRDLIQIKKYKDIKELSGISVAELFLEYLNRQS